MPRLRLTPPLLALLALAMITTASGCGQIVDKDRVVIAQVDGKPITRGELYAFLRRMDDAARPNIRTRNDLQRVLTSYIDEQIKLPMGREFEEALGEAERAQLREQARELFFLQNQNQPFREMWNMEVPPPGQATPLMRQYSLDHNTLMAMRDQVELGTDEQYEKLLGELAVMKAAIADYRAGTLTVDPDALEREYARRAEQLKTFEWMKFRAIRFPAMEGAERQAAEVRERLNAGEPFDAIFKEYATRNPALVVESEIENNPTLAKFQSFWINATGAEPGTVIGPVFLPEYTQQMQRSDGQVVSLPQPASYLVLEVMERRDGETIPLERVRDELAQPLLIAKKLEHLYEERNVEIYEDQLPDPAAFGAAVQDPLAY